jgi:hypothetical protein
VSLEKRVRCRSQPFFDLGIGMILENLGKYQDALPKVMPSTSTHDVVEEWCQHHGERNVIALAQAHQAKPVADRMHLERRAQPAKKSAKPAQEPERCSRRLYQDAPPSSPPKKGDDSDEDNATPEPTVEVSLPTPELMKRRKQLEAGNLPKDVQVYATVLKSSKRLIDVIEAENAAKSNKKDAKRAKPTVISMAKYDELKKESTSNIRRLQAQNADLIMQITIFKKCNPHSEPSQPSPGDAASSFDLARLRLESEGYKEKLEVVTAQKNRLHTAATSVSFDPSEKNLNNLRALLLQLIGNVVQVDHGPALP